MAAIRFGLTFGEMKQRDMEEKWGKEKVQSMKEEDERIKALKIRALDSLGKIARYIKRGHPKLELLADELDSIEQSMNYPMLKP